VDIPKAILKKLTIHPVATIDQVLELALTEMPKPLPPKIETDPIARKEGENAVLTH
jgi:predicted ATP-dependent protease